MRRIVSAFVVCGALGAAAAPASAFNTGTPPGPPDVSFGRGAEVFHCKVINGTKSVEVENRQGESGGGFCEDI